MFMITGDHTRINLGTSLFERLRSQNLLYVDKTRFIENFLNETNTVQLIVRQRRLGKSLNLDTLRCFLTDLKDNRALFEGTYIASSPVWKMANSAPVFYFDFKNLSAKNYKIEISGQIDKHLSSYINESKLEGYLKRSYERFINNPEDNTSALLLLTELVYNATGKRSYILIDEYDKLLSSAALSDLSDSCNTDAYDEIKSFETLFLSAGLKGNEYLEKAIMTGVMRVSRESILSGLNNLFTYDVFSDAVYTDDFGFTEEEIDELHAIAGFDKDAVKAWYNGVKINGKAIYNTYSVVSHLKTGQFDNFWGRSGTTETILNLLNDSREETAIRLLSGETVETPIDKRISLRELKNAPTDLAFYSLLVQTGYLSIETINSESVGTIKIPNIELMRVWKEFILRAFVKDIIKVRTIFDNIKTRAVFNRDMEDYLSDSLSFHDITKDLEKTPEAIYHAFVLGILSAYRDGAFKKPLSNRESGDGRFDILLEKEAFCVIFEFKSTKIPDKLEEEAEGALRQIDEKRYFTDAPKNKPLYKTAIAFCGKRCRAKSALHEQAV
jgi:hypothetical protein